MAGCPERPQILIPCARSPAVLSASRNPPSSCTWDLHPCGPPVAAAGGGAAGSGADCGQARGLSLGLRPGANLGDHSWWAFGAGGCEAVGMKSCRERGEPRVEAGAHSAVFLLHVLLVAVPNVYPPSPPVTDANPQLEQVLWTQTLSEPWSLSLF